MTKVSTIGIDLAKSVFQVHGVDAAGKVAMKRQLKRKGVLAFFAQLPACLIGMEACGSAHYWARELARLGHDVKLMPAKYVKAYVKRGKNDAADAEAICEAVSRPSMREVAVKTVEQQSVLMLHRARDLLVRDRTRTINALRAHMAEIGVIAPAGRDGIAALLAIVSDAADPRLPGVARVALQALAATLASLGGAIAALDRAILAAHKADATSCRLETVPGVGALIASAVTATVGDARVFKSGRAFSAWLGITPRLDGTGGKVTLGPITKQGDRYLRRLLIMGATAVLGHAKHQPDKQLWAVGLLGRMPFKQAAVALANKMARIIWALMVRGGTYTPRHRPALLAATA
ncbi:MAG TPA: IS110 family transposase [Chloroflexota bacterium]|nr:IS110 family transposase [Chloroflexota bacterium]